VGQDDGGFNLTEQYDVEPPFHPSVIQQEATRLLAIRNTPDKYPHPAKHFLLEIFISTEC
jgi:hypothetical protein